jgi:hypothetical protein
LIGPILLIAVLFRPAAAAAPPPGYAEELLARARSEAIARERGWLTLLHYKRGVSDARGDFFLSPKGSRDPEAELEADLLAFFEPSLAAEGGETSGGDAPKWSITQHPQCRYPARFFYLKQRLRIDPSRLPDQPCPRFEQWKAALAPDSVTLVFADAFINNPASMYGHTFLRLRRKDRAPSLLDYTINFAGNPDTDNGALYAVKGIFGLFPGTYTTQPYYMKLQEYSNIEARDLWEYDLALSTPAVAQLIRHAWEMGGTSFPYYFFSENCSYQLLTLLDAADPSLRLADRFGFGTIPGDTVRAALDRSGLVSARRYRPSHIREMLARRAALDERETALAARVARFDASARPALAALPPARQAAVLDSAYDYLRYRTGFSDLPDPRSAASERGLLVARGKLGVPPSEARPPEPPPLEAGHDTARAGLGAGVSSHGIFQELAFRAALHDLAADPRGYQETSQLEMGEIRLRFDDRDKKPYLERAALVDILSLSPWDPWVRKPSWRVSSGVEQAKELGKAPVDSMIYDTSAGFGLAWEPALPLRPLVFAFAEAGGGLGPALAQGWRLGAGGSAGLLLRPLPWWRLLTEATYRDFWQRSPRQERLKLTSSWTLGRDLEARVVLDRRTPDTEAGGYFLLYF